MGVEPALPGMGEGAFGAKDHERAVDREADIHHRSTDRSLDEDEAQPAHAGNRRRADIEAPEPPVETGSRAAYRADQLHRAQQQQDSAGDEMEADRDDRRGQGRIMEALERVVRSEEHTSELQSLMRISYAVFCLKKKNT